MDSMSVYDLLTKLSDSIVIRNDLAPNKRDTKRRSCRRQGVKRLRALAYEILLHKSTFPTYPMSSCVCSDGFQPINDPAYDILLLSTGILGGNESQQMQNLNNSISSIIKADLSEDPCIKSVLELLLNLKDEVPETQSNWKDVGWFNTGLSRVPKKHLRNGSVTPYTIYGPETFRPTLLLKSLEMGMQCGSFQYVLPRNSAFQVIPNFKFSCVTGSSLTSTSSRFTTSGKSTSGQSINTFKSVAEECSALSRASSLPRFETEDNEDLETDPWDLELSLPGPDLGTWEELGQLEPKKQLLHLTEVTSPSIIYDLLQFEKTKDDLSTLARLRFVIVPYTKYICHLKSMLLGVVSTSFRYDEVAERFELQPNVCVEGLSPQCTAANAAEWIVCGSYCRRLNQMYLAATQKGVYSRGRIYGALFASIGEYLYFYKAAIIGISEKCSLLKLQVQTRKLRAQLVCLGHLCKLDSTETLSTGVGLLAYLYDEIMSTVDPDVRSVLTSVLVASVTAYLSFLQTWLFDGSMVDPHHEFFVDRNTMFGTDRTRLYWKKAFVLHKSEAPGFLKGLDKAIFETGKALNLLKLCNPQDALLAVTEDTAPRLRFLLSASELPQLEAEYEAYYQRAVSVAGQPVTITRLLQESQLREADLQTRVKQVYAERAALFAAEQAALAADKAAKQLEQQADMEQQEKLRQEHTAREKQEERERAEREGRKARAREEQERATEEEAKQSLLDHYSQLFKNIEQRKLQVSAEISREEQRYATDLELQSGITDTSSPLTKVSPNNNEVSNGNTDINTNVFLDNYSTNRLNTDYNRLNIDEDMQNRNVETLDTALACDNIIQSSESIQRLSHNSSDSKQEAQRKALSLDLGNKTPRDNQGDIPVSPQALHKGVTESVSQEMYSPDASIMSADRIREKMLGYKVRTRSDLDGYIVTAEGRLKPRSSPNKPMLTAQQIRNKVLEEEYHIRQPPTEPAETDLQANRTRNLHGAFDVVTGANKTARATGTYSKKTREWTPCSTVTQPCSEVSVCSPDVPTIESPTVELSPTCEPSPTIDRLTPSYFRGESQVSVNSLTVAPYACTPSPSGDAGSVSSSESAPNPFFACSVKPSRSFNRMYSYGPCLLFDKDWQCRLRGVTVDMATSDDVTTSTLRDNEAGDMDAVNRTLKKAMIVAVRTQMKLVNDALIKFFLVEQDLLSHLQSLRDYYFLLDGEFGCSLTSSLFDKLKTASRPSELLHPVVLGSVLSEALASSTAHARRNNWSRLSFVLGEVPLNLQHATPDVLACLNLRYDVAWPLNVFITPEVIKKYQQVFEFLLKLRRISWVLDDVFVMLKRLGRDVEYARSPQYNAVQKYRHVMAHLVQALHNYITSTVLQESWAELEVDLKQATIVDDIYHAHVLYIKRVLLRCLLEIHGSASNFQKHLHNIFKLVLKFHGQLTNGKWVRDPRTQHYRHAHYNDFVRQFKLFHEQACSLVKLSRRLATRGHYSHLYDMLLRLNMNEYYEQRSVAM